MTQITPVTPRTAALLPGSVTAPSPALTPPPAAPATAGAGLVGPTELAGPTNTPAPAAATPPVDSAVNRPGRQSRELFDRALNGALKIDPSARIALDRGSNSASFLSGTFTVDVKPGASGTVDRVARGFMTSHGQLFGVTDATAQLKLIGNEKDALGFQHFKYQQYHGKLPVFGQQVIVHAQGNVVKSVGGRLVPNITVPLNGPADEAQVLSALRNELPESIARGVKSLPANARGIYTPADGVPRLAYELDLSNVTGDGRWRYYVDATNGKVLDSWSLIATVQHRETYDGKSGSSRPGTIARKEGEGPTADPIVNGAHDNAGAVYDFYKENFGRDSLDNKGMKLVSTVHHGNKYNNAFWDGRQMTYGDGDGVRFTPFGQAADVVGHEMAHGVTEKTANLRYFKQSGALNESWSDVFGNLIEKWDEKRKNPGAAERDPKWLIGEQIFTPKVDGDGLRSMSAPGTGYDKDPQPGHMKDYKETSSDNGGVHINSGIPNKAAYEAALKIGNDKLAQVWYRAQTNYLTSNSQFTDAANVTVQSAADLFGKDSAEVKAVLEAWTSVGLAPSSKPGIN